MENRGVISATGAVLEEASIEELQASLQGEMLRPGDHGYDEARMVWNRMIDKHPSMIIRCSGVADVIDAVNFARTHELLVAVRGGGHNVAGKAVCDEGMVIDLSKMKGIRVDPTQDTAQAQAGLLNAECDREAQAFGLATTMGVVSDTGNAGLTLGGGYGWLAGKYGMTCDNLLSADVVTADGRFLTASISENEDLFWGLRGGGGNFGVVTSFEYRLHPVDQVLGGMILYPMEKAKDVLRFYHEFSISAPDELSTMAFLATAPSGDPAVIIVLCYCGSSDEGEKVVKPVRTLGKPLADLIQVMSYGDLQKMLDPLLPTGHCYYWKASIIRELSDEAIETLLAHALPLPTPMSGVGFQQLHGVSSRVGQDETAYPHRYDHYEFFPIVVSEDRGEVEKNIYWARELWEAMQPFTTGAVYVNDLGDEGEARVKEAYGSIYPRLVEVKNKYDPTNLFRLNQNVKPTM